MNNDLLKLIAILSSIDEEIEIFVSEMLTTKSRYEIIEFLTSERLNEYVRSLGVSDIASIYYDMMTGVMNTDLKTVSKYVSDFNKDAIQGALDMLINTNVKTFDSNVSSNISVINKTLAESVLSGDTFELSVQKMRDAGMTKTQRIETILHTGYYNVSRISTKMAFKDKPEQKFSYSGGILPTSSDECRWLMQNQKKEGYTMEEIENGIETPFKYTYGRLKGQVKKIFWSGRHPNFNCIHTWLPLGFE